MRKVRTYSYSITVLIDAPTERSAKQARAELWRLVQHAAITTDTVSVGLKSVPVVICVDDRADWTLEEITEATA